MEGFKCRRMRVLDAQGSRHCHRGWRVEGTVYRDREVVLSVILIGSCLVFIQLAGYAIYRHNSFMSNLFEMYDKSVRQNSITLEYTDTGAWQSSGKSGPAVTSLPTENDSPLVKQISSLLDKQLGLNTTSKQYSVTTKCLAKPKNKFACVRPDCPQLSNNPLDRVRSLFSSEKTYLTKAQDDLLRSIAEQIPENDVILLTASSSNHFDEMQSMFHSVHSMIFPEMAKRENFSFVFWDIGLSSTERKQVEKCCRCQVVTFPFEKFHSRTRDLQCYMWKPLVIRMTQLRARKYAVWQDASTRYSKFPGPIFEKGMKQGLQLSRYKSLTSIPHRTLPETFSYFGQEICNFYQYPEIESGFGVYKNDPFVLTAVTSPWARCGFEQDCMCPRETYKAITCYYGPCHRFDQSALGIITATLYSSEMYKIAFFEDERSPFFLFKRGDKEPNYFKSTGCLSN